MFDKRELIRVVKTPEGEISLDIKGKMNGRGAYICKNAQCLNKAVKSKGLERTLKECVPDDVLEKLNKELELGE